MNRNLLTLILVLFCISFAKAEDKKTELITIYAEYCDYSQQLINNTLSESKVKQTIANNFEYKLLEQNTDEAKEYIEKLNITGFPTQIIIKNNNTLFAYGVLSVTEQLDFLNTVNELNTITNYLNDNKTEETQEMSAFAKYVFRETTLDFDQDKKELLIPKSKPNNVYERCDFREMPDRYVCRGGGGTPSHNFITKGENRGDFKVAIFHPSDKTRDSSSSLTSFVEDGKVTSQSRCFYDANGIGLGTGDKMHFELYRMECYVATPELCEVINGVQGLEDIKDESRFESFITVLKSEKYKNQLLEAYQYNWEKAFLNVNRDQHYDYYSKLNNKRFYNIEIQGKDEESKLLNFEESQVVKESKSLYDVLSKAKTLFKKVYLNPCLKLEESKILAKPKSE